MIGKLQYSKYPLLEDYPTAGSSHFRKLVVALVVVQRQELTWYITPEFKSVNSMLANKGVRWIGLGWTAFILENVVLSHNREEIISRFGSNNYHTTYNILSTAACSSILYGYLRHGRGKGPM